MQFLRNKIQNTRKKNVIAFLLCFTWILIVVWVRYGVNIALADGEVKAEDWQSTTNQIYLFFAWLVMWCIGLFGKLFLLFIKLVIWAGSFDTFVDARPVDVGWGVVRDLSNMFFILILLIIAFATILRIESYSYKRLLPSLVIFAVLINFSKTITGLFIDLGQVFMMMFMNAFGDTAESNFLVMVGYGDMMSLDQAKLAKAAQQGGQIPTNVGDLLLGATLALVFLVIASFITLIIAIFLLWRIINLWVLIILSPIAFFCYVIPNGRKYAGKWWQELGTHVATGPVLAFFLWIALVVAGNPSGLPELEGVSKDPIAGNSLAGSLSFSARFITAIGLLVVGMKVAQEFGGVAGNIAGWGSNKLGGMAKIAALGAVPWMAGRPWRVVGGDRLKRMWEGMKRGPSLFERGLFGGRAAAMSGKVGAKHGMIGRIGKFWTGMSGEAIGEMTERDEAALKEKAALRRAGVRAKVYDEKDALEQVKQGQASEKAEEMKKQNLTVPELKANIEATLKKGTLGDNDQVQVMAGLMRLVELDKNMAREKFGGFEKKVLGEKGYKGKEDTAAGRGFARLGVLLNKKAESNITGFKEDTIEPSGYLRLDEKEMREVREKEIGKLAGSSRERQSSAISQLDTEKDAKGNAKDRDVVGAILGTEGLEITNEAIKTRLRKHILNTLSDKAAFGVSDTEEERLKKLFVKYGGEEGELAGLISKKKVENIADGATLEEQLSRLGTLEQTVQGETVSANILEGDPAFTRKVALLNSEKQGDNALLEERVKSAKNAEGIRDILDEVLGIKGSKKELTDGLESAGVTLSEDLKNQLFHIKDKSGLDQFEKDLLQYIEDRYGVEDAKNGLKAAIQVSYDLSDDNKKRMLEEADKQPDMDGLETWYDGQRAILPLPDFNFLTARTARKGKVENLESWDSFVADLMRPTALKQIQDQFIDKTKASGSSFGIAGKTDTEVFQESRLNKDIEDEIALQEAVGKLASETDDEKFYINKATILKYLRAMRQKGNVRARIIDNALGERAKKKYINRSLGKRGFAMALATILGAALGGGIPLAAAGGLITAGAMRAAASEKLTPVDRRNRVKQRENTTIRQLEEQLSTLTKEALTKKALTDKEATEVMKDIVQQVQQTCDTLSTYLYDKNDVQDKAMKNFTAETKDEFKKLDGKQVGDWQSQMSDLKSRLARLKGYTATFTKK